MPNNKKAIPIVIDPPGPDLPGQDLPGPESDSKEEASSSSDVTAQRGPSDSSTSEPSAAVEKQSAKEKNKISATENHSATPRRKLSPLGPRSSSRPRKTHSPEKARHPRASKSESSASRALFPPREPFNRPMTPRADLYKGEDESHFGMTFENSDRLHFRKGMKHTSCPFSYEDHKHRALMDWVNRG